MTTVSNVNRILPELVDQAVQKSFRRPLSTKQRRDMVFRIEGYTKDELKRRYDEAVALNIRNGINPKDWKERHIPIRRAKMQAGEHARNMHPVKITLPKLKIMDSE